MSSQGWAVVAGHLAVLREWHPVYQRWSVHPGRAGDDAVSPWSDSDQARLGRLAVEFDPDQLSLAADRLAAEAVTVEQLAAAVAKAGLAAGGGVSAEVGSALADRCAEVGGAVRSRAADLSALAHDLRRAAERMESWLAELVSLLRRSDGGDAYRSPWSAHRDIDDADRSAPNWDSGSDQSQRWPALDDLVARHSGMISVLRTAVAGAESSDSPWPPGLPYPLGATDDWCGDRGHGAGWPCGSSAWEGGWPPPGTDDVVPGRADRVPVVVDRAEQDRVLAVWQPLPPRLPGPVGAGGLEPGVGPLLPGTEAGRVGTETGVRIAQLPDAPSATGIRPVR